MTRSSRGRLRRSRRLAAALGFFATLSLIGGIGAGGAGLLPCAHHGSGNHSSHSMPAPESRDASRHSDMSHREADHSDLPGHSDRPDHGEQRCDCVGRCTLLAGPVSTLLGAAIGEFPDTRTADEIAPITRPRAFRRGWLYPLPNAPPSA